jgi:hypothetical protein
MGYWGLPPAYTKSGGARILGIFWGLTVSLFIVANVSHNLYIKPGMRLGPFLYSKLHALFSMVTWAMFAYPNTLLSKVEWIRKRNQLGVSM